MQRVQCSLKDRTREGKSLAMWLEGLVVAMREVGKEDKESQVAEASRMNKEKADETDPEALKTRFQGEG